MARFKATMQAGPVQTPGEIERLMTEPTVRPPLSRTELIALTAGAVGLQIAWGIETSYGTPFLQSLGMAKSTLSFVWLAGPVAGLVVQAVVGAVSDNFRSRWGRRRPFIVAGAVVTVMSLIAISFAVETIRAIGRLVAGPNVDEHTVRTASQVYAVVLVYVADVAINVLQAPLRALIADVAPPDQQDVANAWFSRLSGFGHFVCFLLGGADLPALFEASQLNQFQLFCIVGSLLIVCSVGLCVGITKEPRSDRAVSVRTSPSSGWSTITKIGRAVGQLDPTTRAVCTIQSVAWLGWFPVLFYSTSYVGHLYVDPILVAHPGMTDEQVDNAWLDGTRLGSKALMAQSIVSFVASFVLPLLIEPLSRSGEPVTKPGPVRRYIGSLADAWTGALFFFAVIAGLTMVVSSPTGGAILIALVGIPWAVNLWAPFAFIGGVASRKRASLPDASASLLPSTAGHAEADNAGMLFGIHNLFVTAPQIVSTFLCSIIFALSQRPRNQPGDDSVGWTLRFAGAAFFAAALLGRKYKRALV